MNITDTEYHRLDYEITDIEISCNPEKYEIDSAEMWILFKVNGEGVYIIVNICIEMLQDTHFDFSGLVKSFARHTAERLLLERYGAGL